MKERQPTNPPVSVPEKPETGVNPGESSEETVSISRLQAGDLAPEIQAVVAEAAMHREVSSVGGESSIGVSQLNVPTEDASPMLDISLSDLGSGTIPIAQADPEISNIMNMDLGGDKYRVLGELGKGGMGQILLAEQTTLGRKVAVKVMRSPDDEESIQRFFLEASMTAMLEHPNTVRIYDFGRNDKGLMYLVMELLDGGDFKDFVREKGPLSPIETVRLGKQISGALAEAHRKSIIHRDIKPTNLFMVESHELGLQAKLIDFGLVKNLAQNSEVSATGMIVGSPMYMAPEQITSTQVDPRTDIYSFGMTLYFALTGSNPFKVKGLPAVLNAQLNTTPESLIEVVPELQGCPALIWLIETATQKDPKLRLQSAQQMLSALQHIENSIIANTKLELELRDGELIAHEDGAKPPVSTPNIEESGDYPTLLQSATDLQLSKPSHTPKIVALLALLTLGGAAAFFIGGTEGPPPEVATKVEEAPAEPEAKSVLHEILLSSVPTGAEVFEDGILISATPFSANLATGETKDVEVRMEGYVTRTIRLSPASPTPEIKLKKAEEKTKKSTPVKKKAVKKKAAGKTTAPAQTTPPVRKPKKKTDGDATKAKVRDPWAD